jgi:hypothetical protein
MSDLERLGSECGSGAGARPGARAQGAGGQMSNISAGPVYMLALSLRLLLAAKLRRTNPITEDAQRLIFEIHP